MFVPSNPFANARSCPALSSPPRRPIVRPLPSRWQAFATSLWCMSSLLMTSLPSQAAISEYVTRGSFAAAVLSSATDTFDDLTSQLVPTPLARPMGPFSYSIGASTGGQSDLVYGLPSAPSSAPATWLTTNAVESVVSFSGFRAGVNGIGAAFFSTNFLGDIWLYGDAVLRVTATFASGSLSKLLSQTSDTSFLGFVSNEQLLTLTVASVPPASGGLYWLTVAGLTVASLSPVPEASPTALLFIGLPILCWLARRREGTDVSRVALWRNS
jgi:hypothetical protein